MVRFRLPAVFVAVLGGSMCNMAWIGTTPVQPCLRRSEAAREWFVQRSAEANAKPKGKPGAAAQTQRGKRTNLDRLKIAAEKSDAGYATPLVEAVKQVLGEDKLIEMRRAWIQHHTKVIGAGLKYISTKNIGRILFTKLFEIADTDGSSDVDKKEIKTALHNMGFSFVTDKKIVTLMEQADKDGNMLIDYEAFITHCPGTLRKNFAKLASARGRWLGLLS